jgi:hypothetical protein
MDACDTAPADGSGVLLYRQKTCLTISLLREDKSESTGLAREGREWGEEGRGRRMRKVPSMIRRSKSD